MKKAIYIFANLIFLFISFTPAHAQLLIENSISSKQAEQYIKTVPQSELDFYESSRGSIHISEDNSEKAYLSKGFGFGQTKFAWRFNGKVFYTSISNYRSNLEPPKSCSNNNAKEMRLTPTECDHAIQNFLQCHLFIIDTNRKLQAVLPLQIPQPDFIEAKPSCFDVHSMAPAQVVKDGMLIVMGYYDSRWTCWNGQACASGRKESYPDPYYKTTLLVRFEQDADGKLNLSQDDVCMPPLNKYDTIASARKALKLAGCK
jgi:hypothetical protein